MESFGLSSRNPEHLREECHVGGVGPGPGYVPQESVDLVGDHEFVLRDMRRIETAREIDRLRERHVAVVVALNEQHRRFPVGDIRIR